MNAKPISFMMACNDFFGRQPGQGLTDFGTEVKALSTEDRQEIAAGLQALGYHIVEQRLAA